MYIHNIAIRNLRSIATFNANFAPAEYAGWHVLIGDNGAGKSTLVRAIALALVGPAEAAALRQDWRDWLRHKTNLGQVRLELDQHPVFDKATGKGSQLTRQYLVATMRLTRPSADGAVELSSPSRRAKRYIWGNGVGWFGASYGPFRRFAGGDKDYEKLFYSNPRLAPHLSAFGEDVALTEVLDWLQTLHVKRLEKNSEGQILEDLKKLINEGQLLPHNTVLEDVSSEGIVFRDGNGCPVAVPQLSDGYRSVLCMTFELIRQLVRAYGVDLVFRRIRAGKMCIDLPGVVLVDEIDAHLHPTWQRRIGLWFRKFFPGLQFIVTTHSPLVCQAAEHGTVWKLPTPGGDRKTGRVAGTDLQRLLYGDLVEAYDTELFGIGVTRSDSAKQKLDRLAMLNSKSRRSTLTVAERKEQRHLREILATASTASANGDEYP